MEEKTKEAVINATFELLKTKDMNSISIREIAAKAKVNVATISYHFGGKAQLFAYLMKLYWEDLIELCEEFLQKEPVHAEDAYEFCRKYLAKEMSSTSIMRSEQIMYQNYEIDTNTQERLVIQFKAFHKLVTTFYTKSTNERILLAKTVALISALSMPAYWNEVAPKMVGELDSFIEIYIHELIDTLHS